VEIRESQPSPESAVTRLSPWRNAATRFHSVRQCLNHWAAARETRQSGHDWLIGIDPDELVLPGLASASAAGLANLLAAVPRRAEQLIFPTYEAVPRRFDYSDVFTQAREFWTPEALSDPGPDREVWDPYTQTKITLPPYLGHHVRKAAIRLAAREEFRPASVHRWLDRYGRRLESVRCGALLHFNCTGFSSFFQKYRNFVDRPLTFADGRPLKPRRGFGFGW
jgi:hypothetical protein